MRPSIQIRALPELLAGFATDAPRIEVTDLSLDSRSLAFGGAFLACRGTKQHGLDFLEQALARGAAAVLWEPAPGVTAPISAHSRHVPMIAVENLGRRAGEIAARFFGQPSRALHCMGVTGTDGKTSTAWLMAQALQATGKPCWYVGTLGIGRYGALAPGEHTTPDPVNLHRALRAAVDEGAGAVAMEVSSHALDQARVGGVAFHTAVLTNVGRDHLDYHGTVERYAQAKQKLFFDLAPQAAVLNRDDAQGRAWAEALARSGATTRVTQYGLDGATAGRSVIGHHLLLSPTGIQFDVDTHAGKGRIESRLLGRFNACNLLGVLAALLEVGLPLARACEALSRASTVPGRIEGFRGPRAKALVVVDYAHTPQALAQILQAVRAHTKGKLWCVFGCGGDRDRGKRPLMGAAAARHADALIVTDDNPRNEDPAAIVREIQAGFPAGYAAPVIHDRARAIETAVSAAGPDDVVVVAGKGHEETQQYGREKRAFSDRAFVAQLVGSEWPVVSGQWPAK